MAYSDYPKFQNTIIVIVVRILGCLMLLVFPHEHEPERAISNFYWKKKLQLLVEMMLHEISCILILLLSMGLPNVLHDIRTHWLCDAVALPNDLEI